MHCLPVFVVKYKQGTDKEKNFRILFDPGRKSTRFGGTRQVLDLLYKN